ncbi:uncharacterized protein LOC135103255 [Scylla paramamosain]|uniref:uncharacterized protein LOC135103255 n=1 Tax=Scylla paramamosain TaxID=85552 RepID=UPI003082DDD0
MTHDAPFLTQPTAECDTQQEGGQSVDVIQREKEFRQAFKDHVEATNILYRTKLNKMLSSAYTGSIMAALQGSIRIKDPKLEYEQVFTTLDKEYGDKETYKAEHTAKADRCRGGSDMAAGYRRFLQVKRAAWNSMFCPIIQPHLLLWLSHPSCPHLSLDQASKATVNIPSQQCSPHHCVLTLSSLQHHCHHHLLLTYCWFQQVTHKHGRRSSSSSDVGDLTCVLHEDREHKGFSEYVG